MQLGAFRVLRLILEAAVGDGLIAMNPAAKLAMPPSDPDRVGARRVLDETGLAALLNHSGQTLRIETMLRAAAEGGRRRSEICGLRWPDVRLADRGIEARRGYAGRPTKGRRSRIVFCIGETFAERLRLWRVESSAEGASPFGPVCPGRDGGEMHEHTPSPVRIWVPPFAGRLPDVVARNVVVDPA